MFFFFFFFLGGGGGVGMLLLRLFLKLSCCCAHTFRLLSFHILFWTFLGAFFYPCPRRSVLCRLVLSIVPLFV